MKKDKMWSLAPLVIRLAAISLVALALADGGSGSRGLATVKTPRRTTVMPIRNTAASQRKERRRNRRRTTPKTTTTTTTAMYDDDEEHTTPVITTTVDPRSFDHTEMGSCEVPLGMENGMISNESLAASSSYDQSVSPLSSRIRTEIRGGAWCPNGLISTRSRQFLELDLHAEYMITATESQGRFANSIGVEFVESYAVEYWRDALKRWVKYKDFNGNREKYTI
ncbi:epithelial discoidin domain-containing receptor 1-like [Vanessa tameamea]|uniref:Epithelial discoidin domain-containing receptor 1-like n=1 Tax=Vanessa tameamea TaxID=334116 RepID=A0ABM4AYH1_VANTA